MTNNTPESRVLDKFSDKEVAEILANMEKDYPQFDRLRKGWKMVGFSSHKNSKQVPIYVYTWPEKSRYSCETLRELRKERGVGAKERRAGKVKDKKKRMEALDELTRYSEELNLYEDVPKNPLDNIPESV